MSDDSYITIRKEGKEWVGYYQFGSGDREQYDHSTFRVASLKKAIIQAQEEDTEYGYRFIGLE